MTDYLFCAFVDQQYRQYHKAHAFPELIAHGKANFKSVLKHTLEVFKLKFQYFVTTITGMDQLFEVSFSTLAESGRPFSRCGKCRRFMKYIMAKPARLYCNTCDETLALPMANGNIKLHQELKCPLDDFEILYFTAGAKGKVKLLDKPETTCLVRKSKPCINTFLF